MKRFLQTTLHPEWYHGHDKKPPFFEGTGRNGGLEVGGDIPRLLSLR
jgi:hypothetical protein